jgi:hypothetical protein
VVSAPYEVDGRVVGTLGVIGPTRMPYDRMIQIVDITSRLVTNALSPVQVSRASQGLWVGAVGDGGDLLADRISFSPFVGTGHACLAQPGMV